MLLLTTIGKRTSPGSQSSQRAEEEVPKEEAGFFMWVLLGPASGGDVGDSGAVVTPFVQVATYATRNFATLGQL